MSSVVISGDTSGAITLAAPAVAGTNTINLPAAAGTLVLAGTTPSFNGIAFPATQSASADANTLDDYEEGTWTPVITPGSGSLTSYTSYGGYTKVGRLVSVWGFFNINTAGTAGGEGRVTLPFTPATSTSYRNGCGSGREDNALGFMVQFYNQAGNTRADLVTVTGGAITWINGYGYLFSMQYPV
jgi:hypothetical protein